MIQRVIVYKGRNSHDGLYFISQEFNEDYQEEIKRNSNTTIKTNWSKVIDLFNGIDCLEDFRSAVSKAESLYGYEHVSLKKEKRLPICEQVWMLIDGKLQLYLKYGDWECYSYNFTHDRRKTYSYQELKEFFFIDGSEVIYCKKDFGVCKAGKYYLVLSAKQYDGRGDGFVIIDWTAHDSWHDKEYMKLMK